MMKIVEEAGMSSVALVTIKEAYQRIKELEEPMTEEKAEEEGLMEKACEGAAIAQTSF